MNENYCIQCYKVQKNYIGINTRGTLSKLVLAYQRFIDRLFVYQNSICTCNLGAERDATPLNCSRSGYYFWLITGCTDGRSYNRLRPKMFLVCFERSTYQ